MPLHLHLTTILTLLQTASAVQACIHYRGQMPFSDSLPFIANITENLITHNVTLCTLHTTYKEHDLYQRLKNMYPDPEEKRREERGEGDKNTWGFRRWEMRCLDGVRGWVGVGLRGVGFVDERLGKEKGTKREMGWITDVREDVWGERWVFGKDIGCERDKKKEKKEREILKEKEKMKEIEKVEGKGLSELERKREEAKMMILAAIGEKAEKDKEKRVGPGVKA